jgi:hypothetical protein
MVTDTQPCVYAIEPQTTKVPAEKKPINNERPFIYHGTEPPAAKKEDIFFPEPENEMPVRITIREKASIVIVSITVIILWLSKKVIQT